MLAGRDVTRSLRHAIRHATANRCGMWHLLWGLSARITRMILDDPAADSQPRRSTWLVVKNGLNNSDKIAGMQAVS